MATLANQAARQTAGIQTFEQALIWAFLQLKAVVAGRAAKPASAGVPAVTAITATPAYNKLISINPIRQPSESPEQSVVELKAKLPYIASEAYKKAGNFPIAVKPVTRFTPDAISSVAPALTGDFLALVEPPTAIDTLEEYLVWLAIAIEGGNMADGRIPDCSVTTDELGAEPHLVISARLPINWGIYANGNGLIAAAIPHITYIDLGVVPNGDNSISNVGSIGNLTVVGNVEVVGM